MHRAKRATQALLLSLVATLACSSEGASETGSAESSASGSEATSAGSEAESGATAGSSGSTGDTTDTSGGDGDGDTDSSGETTGGPMPLDGMRYFVFGHSLFTWDSQTEPGSEAESSTGYWLGYAGGQSGTQIAGAGQFGQLSYHAIPPSPQIGYSTNAYDPWPSGSFSEQGFTHVVIMPSNFEQTSMSAADYMDDTARVLDYVTTEAPEAEVVIYEHWPEPPLSGAVGNGADLSDGEWAQYRDYTRGAYHDWFVTWQDLIIERYPGTTVRMLPIGPVMADLIDDAPAFAGVAYTDLYADDAPHGRRSTYFLAALITYRALLYQAPELSAPLPAGQIIPQIGDNLPAVLDFIEGRLDAYDQAGVEVY